MDEFGSLGSWPFGAPTAEEGLQSERATARPSLRDIPHVCFANLVDQQRAEEAFLSLSAREVTVLAYLSYGLSAKEVAITLNVSSRTVDTFRTRALLKLRARNTADAVRILAALSARARMAE